MIKKKFFYPLILKPMHMDLYDIALFFVVASSISALLYLLLWWTTKE